VRKLLSSIALAALAVASGPAAAQTTGNGPYYANPSWDQQLPAAQRFIVLANWNNEAVLDRETGLVWQKTPDANSVVFTPEFIHDDYASGQCVKLKVGGRYGWHLPSIQELYSLIDDSQPSGLPSGNPFVISGSSGFWSSTTAFNDFIMGVDFTSPASVQLFPPTVQLARVWCVRGGSGADVQ